jgi:hypothetical protein
LALFGYIKWNEFELISVLENDLDWKKNPNIESSTRGDFDTAILKAYQYRKILGFNDMDNGLSVLIRDKKINREKALKRLNDKSFRSEEIVKEIIEKTGENYKEFKKAVETIGEKGSLDL